MPLQYTATPRGSGDAPGRHDPSLMNGASPRPRLAALLPLLVLGLLALLPPAAHAVPAYARQTGQNCVACHAGGQFPELTPYGRFFKLTAFTTGNHVLPLSVMADFGLNKTRNTKSADPNSDFPEDSRLIFQDASLFLAGKITDNLGVFAQATYDNYAEQKPDGHWSGHTSADNMDFRYADRLIDPSNDLIFGVTVNNNPSVEDVWNSSPAWGYPYSGGTFAITPAAAPLITDGLGQQVAGAGVYALWNDTLYAAITGYRDADGPFSFMSFGIDDADKVKLHGVAPYWRLALTHQWGPHNAMIGTFGLLADVYPDNTHTSGPTSRYRDIGFDAQYQYLLDPHTVTAQASYITEKTDWASPLIGGDVSNASDKLRQLQFKGSYVYEGKYGASLTYLDVTGSSDANLYPALDGGDPIPISGSAHNSPNTRVWIPELFYTPVQNLRVGLQYWDYALYNGGSSNYDGAGRSAKDNNTLFLYAWLVY